MFVSNKNEFFFSLKEFSTLFEVLGKNQSPKRFNSFLSFFQRVKFKWTKNRNIFSIFICQMDCFLEKINPLINQFNNVFYWCCYNHKMRKKNIYNLYSFKESIWLSGKEIERKHYAHCVNCFRKKPKIFSFGWQNVPNSD